MRVKESKLLHHDFLLRRISVIHTQSAQLPGRVLFRVQLFHHSDEFRARKSHTLRRSEGLCSRDVIWFRIRSQIRRFLVRPHNAFAVRVRANPSGMALADIRRSLVCQLFAESLVSFDALFDFVESHWTSFVLIIAGVTDLRVLR